MQLFWLTHQHRKSSSRVTRSAMDNVAPEAGMASADSQHTPCADSADPTISTPEKVPATSATSTFDPIIVDVVPSWTYGGVTVPEIIIEGHRYFALKAYKSRDMNWSRHMARHAKFNGEKEKGSKSFDAIRPLPKNNIFTKLKRAVETARGGRHKHTRMTRMVTHDGSAADTCVVVVNGYEVTMRNKVHPLLVEATKENLDWFIRTLASEILWGATPSNSQDNEDVDSDSNSATEPYPEDVEVSDDNLESKGDLDAFTKVISENLPDKVYYSRARSAFVVKMFDDTSIVGRLPMYFRIRSTKPYKNNTAAKLDEADHQRARALHYQKTGQIMPMNFATP